IPVFIRKMFLNLLCYALCERLHCYRAAHAVHPPFLLISADISPNAFSLFPSLLKEAPSVSFFHLPLMSVQTVDLHKAHHSHADHTAHHCSNDKLDHLILTSAFSKGFQGFFPDKLP